MLSFDVETTGTDPRTAKIVTSALVSISGRQVQEQELLADPGVDIPQAATDVHGITTEYARSHGQPLDQVVAQTIAALRAGWEQGQTVIVFNAPYDLSVLRALDPSFTVDGLVFDPLLAQRVLGEDRRVKKTLGNLCQVYGVALDNAHNATADALAAARLAWKMAKLWPQLTTMSGDELMEWQAVKHYEWKQNLRAWFESKGQTLSDDSDGWPTIN